MSSAFNSSPPIRHSSALATPSRSSSGSSLRGSSQTPTPAPALSPSELPPTMYVHGGVKLLVCREHGGCYARNQINVHLRDVHHIKGRQKKRIMDWLRMQDIAPDRAAVRKPERGRSAIDGLPVCQGFTCSLCERCSINKDIINRHNTKSHEGAADIESVLLQTLWKQGFDWFIVIVGTITEADIEMEVRGREQDDLSDPDEDQIRQQLEMGTSTPVQSRPQRIIRRVASSRQRSADRAGRAGLTSSQGPEESSPVVNGWNSIMARHRRAQDTGGRYEKVNEMGHVSELTPMLRSTKFHIHLADFEGAEIIRACRKVDMTNSDEEGALFMRKICGSVDRIIRQGMQHLRTERGPDRRSRTLTRLQTRILNTFRRVETSQDPIQPLQETETVTDYITTFQRLCCYIFRVSSGGVLSRGLFVSTSDQIRHAEQVIDLIRAHNEIEMGEGDEVDEEVIRERSDELDRMVLDWCMSLIRHRVDENAFDSCIISFCAAMCWSPQTNTWKMAAEYSGPLAALNYDIQMMVLRHCVVTADEDRGLDFTDYLLQTCNDWMLNDCRGPMAELLSLRLLVGRIARNTVSQARIFWYSDGQTMVYRDLIFSLDNLKTWIGWTYTQARQTLCQDLCFDLDGLPVFDPTDLKDNWDNILPGSSFLEDPRNETYLEGGREWLIEQLQKADRKILDAWFYEGEDGEWKVRSDAARMYEDTVQQFLRYLFTLMHIGSGMPGRKKEIGGIRFQNVQSDKRNIIIHDGHVLFLLEYHKSLNVTNASRYPVRYLLPEVAVLLLQYLIVVLPFRRFLTRETGVPESITEYLFSSEREVWEERKITKAIQNSSSLSIGVEVNIQAWRQMCIGIAIKHFGGVDFQLDVDVPGDANEDGETEEPFGLALPDALHHQAAHNPYTGNQAYGGTVNFKSGLTDAALQEYKRVSLRWHKLCRGQDARDVFIGHKRTVSGSPLMKKLAWKRAPRRHRLRWTLEDAAKILRRLFDHEEYKTPMQKVAMEKVLQGDSEVVANLATNEGKSLLYMLPSLLPKACTTVVLTPLKALKADTLRRCDQRGIPYQTWKRGQSDIYGCPLVFASADEATYSGLRGYLARLDAANQLDRIVLDEAHLVITTTEYRTRLRLLRNLRDLLCQFVFLTATLPPARVEQFKQELGLFQPTIVRSTTFRYDLQWTVMMWGREVVDDAADAIRLSVEDAIGRARAEDRYIVYAYSQAEVEMLAERLGCEYYHSEAYQGSDEAKAAVVGRWMQGHYRAICATTAFGPGIDYAHVRQVWHHGPPVDAIEWIQQGGRAGRDGKGGICMVVMDVEWERGYDGRLINEAKRVVQDFAAEEECRVGPLTEYVDGRRGYCRTEATACDICREHGLVGERVTEAGGVEVVENAADIAGENTDSDEVENDREVERVRQEELRLLQGRDHLRQRRREETRWITECLDRLRLFKDVCFICRQTGEMVDTRHGLDGCRNQIKFRFFDAKKEGAREGRKAGRKGWMDEYTGCFGCLLPQEICPQQGERVDGRWQCEFRDMAGPAAIGAWYRGDWKNHELEVLTGRDFNEDRAAYIRWLGEKRVMWGLKASNLFWILDSVMKDLTGGLDI